jgi:hypothetical protein
MLRILFSLVFLIPLCLFEGFWWLVQSFLFFVSFVFFFCFPYFFVGGILVIYLVMIMFVLV